MKHIADGELAASDHIRWEYDPEHDYFVAFDPKGKLIAVNRKKTPAEWQAEQIESENQKVIDAYESQRSDDEVAVSLLSWQIKHDLEPFRNYMLLVDRFLTDIQKDSELQWSEFFDEDNAYIKLFPKLEQTMPIKDGVLDFSYHKHIDTMNPEDVEVVANLIRQSIIVSIYSYLEAELTRLSKLLGSDKSLQPSDLQGDGVDRSKAYMTKVLDLTFPGSSSEWEEIKQLQRVRNCIAHAGGDITRMRNEDAIERIREYVARKGGRISIVSEMLVIQSQFCEEMISTVEKFLTMLRVTNKIFDLQ